MEFAPQEELESVEVKKKGQVFDLMHLSSEEKEGLATRVEKWNGLVRVFVHPMFEKWRGHEPKYINDPKNHKLFELTKMIAKLASMEVESTPPIIVLEEKKYADHLREWIAEGMKEQFGADQLNDLYVVHTLPNKADPVTEKDGEWDGGFQGNKLRWDPLRDLLDDLGVKKILLGGDQLKVATNAEQISYNHCVGTTFQELSREKGGRLEVEFSALAHPHSRKDVNEARNKIS